MDTTNFLMIGLGALCAITLVCWVFLTLRFKDLQEKFDSLRRCQSNVADRHNDHKEDHYRLEKRLEDRANRVTLAVHKFLLGSADEARDILLGRVSKEAVDKELRGLEELLVKGGVVPSSWRIED